MAHLVGCNSDGVAHPRVLDALDASMQVANLARAQAAARRLAGGGEHADLERLVLGARIGEADLQSKTQNTGD
jgi:hypothetical protein